jgi:hypothetical protein
MIAMGYDIGLESRRVSKRNAKTAHYEESVFGLAALIDVDLKEAIGLLRSRHP